MNWMIKRLSVFCALFILFLALGIRVLNAYSFPYVFFFPFYPGFSFYLSSDAGNKIGVESNIEMTDNYDDSGILYVTFDIDWERDSISYEYEIECMVDSVGNVYLSSISDGEYSRMIFDEVVLFPDDMVYEEEIELGKQFTITYVERLDSYTVNDRTFYDVIEATIRLWDKKLTVYFGEYKGIIEIETESEVYSYIS